MMGGTAAGCSLPLLYQLRVHMPSLFVLCAYQPGDRPYAPGHTARSPRHAGPVLCARSLTSHLQSLLYLYLYLSLYLISSQVLCALKPAGCRPLDLLPSLLAGQCGGCGAVMSLRGVQVRAGATVQVWFHIWVVGNGLS